MIRYKLICNECHKSTFGQKYVNDEQCFYYGSNNVGMDTNENEN